MVFFVIKSFYLLDTFLGGFLLNESKTNLSHAFVFTFLSKANLDLSLRYKVIFVKSFKFAFEKSKT